MSDEKPPIADNEVPKEAESDAPLTTAMFSAQMQRLTERARAAGLKPLHMMAQTYARRGMAMLDGLLASLESNDSSKKKGE